MSLKSRCWTVWDSCCGYRWRSVALWHPYDCDQRQPATQMNVAVCWKQHISVAFWKKTNTSTWENIFFLLCLKETSCSAPLLVQTRKLTHHALLKTVPYNSCHRKTRWVRWSVYHLLQQISGRELKKKIIFYAYFCHLCSTKSEKEPQSVQWNPGGIASTKMIPEQEESPKPDVSNSSPETRSNCHAAGKLFHVNFTVLRRKSGTDVLELRMWFIFCRQ